MNSEIALRISSDIPFLQLIEKLPRPKTPAIPPTYRADAKLFLQAGEQILSFAVAGENGEEAG